MTLAAWMAYAVLVSLPVAGATWTTATVLRRGGRPERWVWLTGLGVAVVLPVLALASDPAAGGTGAGAGAGGAVPLPGVLVGAPAAVRVPVPDAATWLAPAAAGAWLLMSLALAGWWLRGLWLLGQEARGWRIARVDGQEVRVSAGVGPAVVGFFSPRIVVPEWVMLLPWHPGVWFLTAGLR